MYLKNTFMCLQSLFIVLPVYALSETFFLFILKYNLELWLQNEKKKLEVNIMYQ